MEFLTDYATVVTNRSYYNVPLNYHEEDNRFIIATTTPYGTYKTNLMKTDVETLAKFDLIKSKCNLPIIYSDRRVISHDFGKSATWASPSSSKFSYTPPVGKKFILINMRVRCPLNIKFTTDNAIQFKLNLYIVQYGGLIPALSFEYGTVAKMLRQSDDPISVQSDIIPNLGQSKIIEVNYKYATLDAMYMSPIQLKGTLNENIEMCTKANSPILDMYDQPLVDDTWVLLVGRLVDDF